MSAEISNFSEQMLIGRVHAKSRAHAEAVAFALDGIRAMLCEAPRCYVSLSFGKQSLCLAHLAMRVQPDIPMYFLASSETWSLYDYERVVHEFVSQHKPNLTIVQTERLAEAESWKEARDLGDQDLQRMCPREEWDGWLWGLTTEESRQRQITLAQGVKQRNAHPSIFRYSDGKLRGCPIMRWGIEDLAAYIATHDIPLLNIYQRYGLTQRTTARITKKMARNSAMALARQTSGPALSRITNKFPDIRIW